VDLGGAPHVELVAVRRRWQGRGIGTALLDHAAATARRAGAKTLTAATYADVPFNGPWFSARGFQVLEEASWTAAQRALVDLERAAGLAEGAPRVLLRLELD
jgi:N-acetylglutamate synthase-like GNAT family acetyltransferase